MPAVSTQLPMKVSYPRNQIVREVQLM
jgi:hypothetical protein